MQFLGTRKSVTLKFGRGSGMATFRGTLFAVSLGGLASLGCQAGSLPDCDTDEDCKAMYVKAAKGQGGGMVPAGTGGTMMPAGTGGTMMPAGTGGAKAPDAGPVMMAGGMNKSPVMCKTMKTQMEIEEKLILPKCGKGVACHGGTTFPPNLSKVGMMAAATIDKAGLGCDKNKYVDKADPSKSLVIVQSKTAKPMCPTGGAVVSRMPRDPEIMLTADEIDCLTWWTYEVVK